MGLPRTFEIGERDLLLDGEPIVIRCGEMHFARIPQEYWQHRLKMARAMGLNTVCAYLYWNRHEPRPGEFCFDGWDDAAEFCRLAQQENLLVILRPGPYSCAEWDLGGLPWWLLKTSDIRLRTRDPGFMYTCRRYLLEVGRHLGPLQIDRGGPIIMVQVENEYGSYGNDREYIGILRDNLLEAGFTVPLFTCDGPSQLKNDVRDDIFSVVNFAADPTAAFDALRAIRPSGPLMCGEFYPGWFDSWGRPHHLGSTETVVKDLRAMLDLRASFSIYMAHGGTSFGFSAGANAPPFSPQSTSYDYDAPIDEAGNATPKFWAMRELFEQYLEPGEALPAVPERTPVISFAPIRLNRTARLLPPVSSTEGTIEKRPRCMEMYDVPHGCILYRTRLGCGEAGLLNIRELHDFGIVFMDGKRIATLDRRHGQNSCPVPARASASTLDILVEAMGHVNYGAQLHDRKGITERVDLVVAGSVTELLNWQIVPLPLDETHLQSIEFTKQPEGGNRTNADEGPAFFLGTFQLETIGDTYLDMRSWGKGFVWINGHNLGRYWSIGPQQTLYLPGVWLKAGENKIVILDMLGPEMPVVAGLDSAILNQVRPDAIKPVRIVKLTAGEMIHQGEFGPDSGWHEARFAAKPGRFFCLQSDSSHDDDATASAAEIELLGPDGKLLPRIGWQIVHADSEELQAEDGAAVNVLNGIPTTIWQTQWRDARPDHPHLIVIDLGQQSEVSGLRYLPRSAEESCVAGRIKKYRAFLSVSLFEGL
jgi:beta-galactosidase